MEDLLKAKEIYKAEKKSLFEDLNDEQSKSIFADKGQKMKQKNAKERPTSPQLPEDPFREKRK